jgi:hypothetical protein
MDTLTVLYLRPSLKENQFFGQPPDNHTVPYKSKVRSASRIQVHNGVSSLILLYNKKFRALYSMMDVYICDYDIEDGKVLKKRKLNPIGEDVYLQNEIIVKDEDKIIRTQQIFKHNYYKPGGKWFMKQKRDFS